MNVVDARGFRQIGVAVAGELNSIATCHGMQCRTGEGGGPLASGTSAPFYRHKVEGGRVLSRGE
jgi:hypothetical protein